MQLTEILEPDCVKVPLPAKTKQGAIFALAEVLAGHAGIDDVQALKDAIWEREQIRTTGIGHGIAIPHGKVSDCERLVMAVGICEEPVEFGAIDGKPVEVIFLLASPLDQTGPHIQALATISRMLTNPELRQAIRTAASGEALYGLIAEHDAKQPTA